MSISSAPSPSSPLRRSASTLPRLAVALPPSRSDLVSPQSPISPTTGLVPLPPTGLRRSLSSDTLPQPPPVPTAASPELSELEQLGLPEDTVLVVRSLQAFSSAPGSQFRACRLGCVVSLPHGSQITPGLPFAFLGTHGLPEWVGCIVEPELTARGWVLFRTVAMCPYAPELSAQFRILIIAKASLCGWGTQPPPKSPSLAVRLRELVPALFPAHDPAPRLTLWGEQPPSCVGRASWLEDHSDFFNYARTTNKYDVVRVRQSVRQQDRSRILTNRTLATIMPVPEISPVTPLGPWEHTDRLRGVLLYGACCAVSFLSV
ncbi:hypothetical protein PsYK624_170780 [Phanerochaete sordida]|uniref:Uncharacterized protein n=1 Tax=Phanerochaete sordida TaxID=48140 RepID=A0A9P3GT11_9APHY|nr:hypothetical protein PsYK624_170780 [Phanerochaete sordida]